MKMGCLFTRANQQETSTPPVEEQAPVKYSWDKRERVDPKDITIENLKDDTAGRLPGKIHGQQFIIQNCENCNIYLFDHSAQVTIDDCVNCRIFVGPVKGSIFIRDCTDCAVIVACQQFRTRDCKRVDLFLSCVSQPIIESSHRMRFACFQYYYPELEGQMKSAGMSIYNNNWSSIHDFTPMPDTDNFSLLPEDSNPLDFVPQPSTEEFHMMNVSTNNSVIPKTLGKRRKTSEESCLVVFFSDGLSHDRARDFITEMREKHTTCSLVRSKEITMQPTDAQRVFTTESYAMAVAAGPVIGAEYNGADVCKLCHEALVVVSKGSTGLVFVSQSPQAAAAQIDNFFDFADMQMNA